MERVTYQASQPKSFPKNGSENGREITESEKTFPIHGRNAKATIMITNIGFIFDRI